MQLCLQICTQKKREQTHTRVLTRPPCGGGCNRTQAQLHLYGTGPGGGALLRVHEGRPLDQQWPTTLGIPRCPAASSHHKVALPPPATDQQHTVHEQLPIRPCSVRRTPPATWLPPPGCPPFSGGLQQAQYWLQLLSRRPRGNCRHDLSNQRKNEGNSLERTSESRIVTT